MLALGSGLLLLARLGLVAAVGVSGSPPPSPCLPFDPFAADLQRGHWKFSKPKHWREENCTREFLVDRTPSFMSPPGCSERAPALRRFAADDVRGCLHNKHLLFIGDSVTRHQFESLIVLLETNSPAKGVSSNPTPHSALFRNSTNYNGCGERMRCETNRNANNHTALMENRYYFHPRHNITITMLGLYAYAFGHAPVGWRPASVPFSEEYEWSEAGIPTLAGVIRQWFGAVDVLQVNAGIWGLPAVMKRTWRSVSQYTAGPWQKARDELARLTPLVRQTPIWATNTRGKRDRYPDVAGDAPVHYPEEWYGAGYQAARALQWRILDRSGITTQLRNYRQSIGLSRDAVMTDDYHYMPFVNDEFNNVLLNMICPL